VTRKYRAPYRPEIHGSNWAPGRAPREKRAIQVPTSRRREPMATKKSTKKPAKRKKLLPVER
jgi:hypothetical protein